MNEIFAEAAWPNEDPIGRVVEMGLESAEYTVIGVVANTRTDLVTDNFAPQVYTMLAQDYAPGVAIAVRERLPSADFVSHMRREILAVDPALALGSTRSMEDLANLGLLPQRIAAGIASTLGMLALFLSAVGVYGIVAFSVSQRTREIGVRIALGASRREVLGRVMRGALGLAAPGFVVGTLLAVALGYALRAALVGVRPLDPVAYGVVALILLAVITAASIVPARRASAIEPMDALRYD